MGSRDLAPQVQMIREFLPQCSEDLACEALIQSEEDVEKALELLLSKIATGETKTPKRQDENPKKAGTSAPVVSTEALSKTVQKEPAVAKKMPEIAQKVSHQQQQASQQPIENHRALLSDEK